MFECNCFAILWRVCRYTAPVVQTYKRHRNKSRHFEVVLIPKYRGTNFGKESTGAGAWEISFQRHILTARKINRLVQRYKYDIHRLVLSYFQDQRQSAMLLHSFCTLDVETTMCTVKSPLWQGKNKYEGINTFEGTSLKVMHPQFEKKIVRRSGW